jgi:regulatory protein
LIKQALADLAGAGAGDLAAACALVRRRRLGPLRPKELRERHFMRDLGALARAGFALDIARRVLACGGEAALDRLARGDHAAGGGSR